MKKDLNLVAILIEGAIEENELSREMNIAMDGSGECGAFIHEYMDESLLSAFQNIAENNGYKYQELVNAFHKASFESLNLPLPESKDRSTWTVDVLDTRFGNLAYELEMARDIVENRTQNDKNYPY